MNTKTLIVLLAALGSGSLVGHLAAQSSGAGAGGGSGSSGTGASGSTATGSASSTSGSASPTASSPQGTAISPRASRADSVSTRTAPDLSPTNPSRSSNDPNAPAPGANALPPGISRVPTPEGVSPISGLPRSQIPSTSRGAPPEIPRADVSSRTGSGALEPTGRTVAPPGSTAEVVGTSGQPAPNPQSDAATFVPTPPPVAPSETSAPSSTPGDTRVWVPGHYTWNGSQWTWVSGSMQRAPGEGSVWIPGHYDATTHRWTAPHWGPSGSGGQAPKPRR